MGAAVRNQITVFGETRRNGRKERGRAVAVAVETRLGFTVVASCVMPDEKRGQGEGKDPREASTT